MPGSLSFVICSTKYCMPGSPPKNIAWGRRYALSHPIPDNITLVRMVPGRSVDDEVKLTLYEYSPHQSYKMGFPHFAKRSQFQGVTAKVCSSSEDMQLDLDAVSAISTAGLPAMMPRNRFG